MFNSNSVNQLGHVLLFEWVLLTTLAVWQVWTWMLSWPKWQQNKHVFRLIRSQSLFVLCIKCCSLLLQVSLLWCSVLDSVVSRLRKLLCLLMICFWWCVLWLKCFYSLFHSKSSVFEVLNLYNLLHPQGWVEEDNFLVTLVRKIEQFRMIHQLE